MEQQLEKRTLSIFDIVASFYIDYIYNKLNSYAVMRLKNNKIKSITDGYLTLLNTYYNHHRNKDGYSKNINELHKYFCKYTKFNIISFSNFTDKILQEFIPTDYFSYLNNTQKNVLLCKILNKSLSYFISRIIKGEKIYLLTDNRPSKENVLLLKKLFIDNLTSIRREYYSNFLTPKPKETNRMMISDELYKAKTQVEELTKKVKELEMINLKYKLIAKKCQVLSQQYKEENFKINAKLRLLENKSISNKNRDNRITPSLNIIHSLNSNKVNATLPNNNVSSTNNDELSHSDELNDTQSDFSEDELDKANEFLENELKDDNEMDNSDNISIMDF